MLGSFRVVPSTLYFFSSFFSGRLGARVYVCSSFFFFFLRFFFLLICIGGLCVRFARRSPFPPPHSPHSPLLRLDSPRAPTVLVDTIRRRPTVFRMISLALPPSCAGGDDSCGRGESPRCGCALLALQAVPPFFLPVAGNRKEISLRCVPHWRCSFFSR